MVSGGFVHNTLVQRNGCRRPDVQLSSHFPIPLWPASTLLFQWQWPCPGHTIFKHTHKTNTQTGFSESIFTEHYLVSGSRPAPCPCPVFTFISHVLTDSFPSAQGLKHHSSPAHNVFSSAALAKYMSEVFYQTSQWPHSKRKTMSPSHNEWFERLNKQSLLTSGQFQKFKTCFEGMTHINSCIVISHRSRIRSRIKFLCRRRHDSYIKFVQIIADCPPPPAKDPGPCAGWASALQS